MLADHLPHELAIDWHYAELLLITIAAIVAVVALISGRQRPIHHRLLLGAGIGLAVILPTMTWGYCADRLPLGLLALLLASPSLVALVHRVIRPSLADVSFVVSACAVLGLFLVGQGRGCWRDESYIDDSANLYAVLVAIPMLASWLCSWSWSHPTQAAVVVRRLASVPSTYSAAHARRQDAKALRPSPAVPSATQAQRARWLAHLALLPMAAGAILITSVLFAPVGIVVFGSGLAVRRASRPVQAGLTQWSGRSVVGLVICAVLTVCGGTWLLIWAWQKEFSFSSAWSPVFLWGVLAWSVIFTVLVVRSLRDRRASSAAAKHAHPTQHSHSG